MTKIAVALYRSQTPDRAPQLPVFQASCRALRQMGVQLLCIGWICTLPSQLFAQTINWSNTSGGFWHTGTNWTGGVVPIGGNTARFNLANTYIVDWNATTGNTTTSALQVQAGNVFFRSATGTGPWTHNVTGALTVETNGTLFLGNASNARFNMTAGQLLVRAGGRLFVQFGSLLNTGTSDVSIAGVAGTGALGISGGSVVTSQAANIGDANGGNGIAFVDGTGSQWNLTDILRLGNISGSSGALTVQSGGSVTSLSSNIGFAAGATGNASVFGTNSTWTIANGMSLGGTPTTNGGVGTLTVSSGGRIQVGNDTFDSGTNAEIIVGDTVGANAVLTVRNGSTISSRTANSYIGATSGKSGSATVTGTGSQWNNSSMFVGSGGNGTLNIQSGGVVTSFFGSIGDSSGSTGTASVTGTGSQWNNSSGLYVGNSGNGTLNIQSGGVVTSGSGFIGLEAGSTGTATVTGTGSQWNSSESLYVGYGGNGTLNIQSGGAVTFSNGSIGYSSGSTGTATVTGTGSQWNTGDLSVGSFGNGTLDIESGGTVTGTRGYLGFSSGSTGTATVTGTGSQWNNSMNLSVGNSGNGTLNIQSDGMVTSYFGSIGANSGSTGTATVTGTGSKWNNSAGLFVGEYGNGTLNIQSGGMVTSSSGSIGAGSSSTGTATVTGTGSKWNNSAGLFVGEYGNGTLNIQSGGTVTSSSVSIGDYSGSTGTATVTGTGSQWNNSASLDVGRSGNGTLNVESGGTVNSSGSAIGLLGSGSATVTGPGSQWNNSSDLTVGFYNTGTLNVQSGGAMTNLTGYIGQGAGSTGTATVTDAGSQWTSSTGLLLGASDATTDGGMGSLSVTSGGRVQVGNDTFDSGTSSEMVIGATVPSNGVLTVRNGSTINNAGSSYIGATSGKTGSATVTGTNTSWTSSTGLLLGAQNATTNGGVGSLSVTSGGRVQVGNDAFDRGPDSELVIGDSVAANGSLVVRNGSTISNAGKSYIGATNGKTGSATVTGTNTSWTSSTGLFLGAENATTNGGVGSLSVNSGGRVQVGNDTFDSGTGSEIVIGDTVGDNGSLTVRNGSTISNNGNSFVGASTGKTGSATINGAGSQWNNTGELNVGRSGNGSMDVQSGAVVTNTHGFIARNTSAVGTVTVTDANSHWSNSGNLSIGAGGVGNLNINNNGLVTVGGTTTIGSDDNVTLNGGGFVFGTASMASFDRIGGTSGWLEGSVTNTSFTNVGSLTAMQNLNLDMSEVQFNNSGTLVGSATLGIGFTNTSTGRIDAGNSSVMRFEGDNNVNNGRINSTGGLLSMAGDLTNTGTGRITNLGGQIVSEGQITNQAGGSITGRGEFTAEGGFINQGSMAFSGGFADIVGNVQNLGGGSIITSGGGTTTFYGNVIHNGAEIRTAAGSSTVFLGSYTGAQNFPGTGSVFFEGNVLPGNSPAIVTFGGDVTFGSNATPFFEIGGTTPGVTGYDQMQINGNLFINNSTLDVSLINLFSLSPNLQFLIASVGGSVNGQFAGLGEGDIVGNFGGTDLFITYSGFGSLNGVGLFTAVPEPSSFLGAFVLALSVARYRKRRRSAT